MRKLLTLLAFFAGALSVNSTEAMAQTSVAPLDLKTQQALCFSAVKDYDAAVLTLGEEGFLFAEDADGDGNYSESETVVFEATYSTTLMSGIIGEWVKAIEGSRALSPIQQLVGTSGEFSVGFYYGIVYPPYADGHVGVFHVVNTKTGAAALSVPMFCQENAE